MTTATAEPTCCITCPYCGATAELVESKDVYRRDHDRLIWRCEPCGAMVGCHPGTSSPLGTLANKELRQWRRNCHSKFDPLWKTGKMKRTAAYRMMRELLNIPEAEAHIGMFDIARCKLFFRLLCERESDASR